MRSLTRLSLVGLALGIAMSAQSSADTWSKASVDLVGVQPNGTDQAYVYLTDTAPANPLFTKRFFRVKGTNYAEALQVLLAASTDDRKVHILSDVDQVGPNDVATISVLYLTREPVTAAQ